MDSGQSIRQYLLITANYWAFTLTDGALRMLVVLHFHNIGFSPLEIAFLFLFYEFFGVVTNLAGGWLGARFGLNHTMNIGLCLQVAALAMLLVPSEYLTIVWVMCAQAVSGIAKDLNKMSAKSAIKVLLPEGQDSRLFKWIARLTGSKNALKGMGFFIGGVLLSKLGFHHSILTMGVFLTVVFVLSIVLLRKDLGKASRKPKLTQLLSKSKTINQLSAARLFLFAARDVWFVVALPVYMISVLGWQQQSVGTFFALWIIAYGFIQSLSPSMINTPTANNALVWCIALLFLTTLIAVLFNTDVAPQITLLLGLAAFCFIFAMNSSIHSYLIVRYANADQVSMDVGFYYMANASGRLLGTIASGLLYQSYGLSPALWASVIFLAVASYFTARVKQS